MQTKRFLPTLLLLVLAMTMSSCEIIGDIFKAGAWTGGLVVVLGIALVIWLISRLFGGGSRNP